ncbi:hypothetical protein XENOCAPTIV_017389 [Xenoophorus captivus]|uniref:Uncharacterized protein n=1 Tax=Xenoophorus captivus TaxID=1517983 RepID=A0ABV0S9T8_9TELE
MEKPTENSVFAYRKFNFSLNLTKKLWGRLAAQNQGIYTVGWQRGRISKKRGGGRSAFVSFTGCSWQLVVLCDWECASALQHQKKIAALYLRGKTFHLLFFQFQR